jgi:hypothetical protein
LPLSLACFFLSELEIVLGNWTLDNHSGFKATLASNVTQSDSILLAVREEAETSYVY